MRKDSKEKERKQVKTTQRKDNEGSGNTKGYHISILREMSISPMTQTEYDFLKKGVSRESENALGNINMTTKIKHSKHSVAELEDKS